MLIGYLFAVLALLSIGVLGILRQACGQQRLYAAQHNADSLRWFHSIHGPVRQANPGRIATATGHGRWHGAVLWRARGSGLLDIPIWPAIRENHYQLDLHESLRGGAGDAIRGHLPRANRGFESPGFRLRRPIHFPFVERQAGRKRAARLPAGGGRAPQRESVDHRYALRIPAERHLPLWSSHPCRSRSGASICGRCIWSIGTWPVSYLDCWD